MSALTLHMRWLSIRAKPQCGDDGLTDSERAEYAARWHAGVGAVPAQHEIDQLRALSEQKRATHNVG